MEEITTKQIMEYLIRMDQKIEMKFDQMNKKFESKFDLLFDAVGDINVKFTVIDYKFLQLKRQVHAA